MWYNIFQIKPETEVSNTATIEIKQVIAKNLSELRKKNNMTQFELAEKLNYTDKAVSKWERGESVPDIAVLKEIASIFSVTVDYLITDDHSEKEDRERIYTERQRRNHRIIAAMSSVLVWFIATFAFVNIGLISKSISNHWLAFVYAVPVTFIVLLVLNAIWGKRKLTFILVSFLIWSIIITIYLTAFSHNLWQLFIIGIPAQVIICLWAGLKPKQKI